MVSEGRAWPSWSAICRADSPASSRIVAFVFRKVWDVIHARASVSVGLVASSSQEQELAPPGLSDAVEVC